jgi:hypothetical protein
MRAFFRWILISFLLLALCSCGPVTPGPGGSPTNPPLPDPTAVPATPGPTAIPATLEPTPIYYSPELWKDWPEYRNDEYGFAFQYPPDWQVELDQREDSTSTGHLLWLKSPHEPLAVFSIGFKRVDEAYGINRTGMGSGEIVQRGTIVFLGEPIRRDFLVAMGKDMALLYNSAGLVQRGDLVFTLGLDYQGGYASPTALSRAIENEADTIVASFRATK